MAWGVAALVAVWAVDSFYLSPWLADMKKLGDDLNIMRSKVKVARVVVSQNTAVMAEWNAVRGKLARGNDADTLQDFLTGIQLMSGHIGLSNWSSKPGREQKIGEKGNEFVEYAVETSFQASWKQFVDLLKELKGWKDFVKVQRLAITSKYEKDNRLDVEMRVSTIELASAKGAKP